MFAQTSAVFIDSIAGGAFFDNRAPRETKLIQPQAVWIHPNGDLYIADGNFVVRRVTGNTTTIVAGSGTVIEDSVPVPGKSASFDYPSGLAGTTNELYISDVRRHRIRRLNLRDGTVTTVVGRGTLGFSGDGGRGSFAELYQPTAIVLSANGEDLFIADTSNYRVRRFNTRTGIITTYAGTGDFGNTGDGGQARQAKLGRIRGLALDSMGNLYVADAAHYVVRRITPAGVITRVAGTGQAGFSGDGGPALNAKIDDCFGLAIDAQNNLYIADTTNGRIRLVTPAGVITTYAGGVTPPNPGVENVVAPQATVQGPTAIAFDARGNLYIPEANSDLVRRVDAATKIITTIAGTPNPFDNELALNAPLVRQTSVATDGDGNIYVADEGHYRVRRIDRRTGRITTIAGDGRRTGTVGATANSIGSTLALSVDPLNRLLIADRYNGIVRRVDLASGRMTTVVDLNRFQGEPTGVASNGTYIWVSDWWNDIVWEWDGARLVRLAGTGDTGYNGDDILAPEAKLNGPLGLLYDSYLGLLICDADNHRVRQVDFDTLLISTFAGDGLDDSNYDGYPATIASIMKPRALAVDEDGYIYIADEDANEIRFVTPDGVIDTLAGGEVGFAGDGGPAVLARFDTPMGVAAHGFELYVSDSSNYRIRRLFVKSVPNDLSVEPRQLSFRASQNGDEPAPQIMILNSSSIGIGLNYTIYCAEGSTCEWIGVCQADAEECSTQGATPDVVFVYAYQNKLQPGFYSAKLLLTASGSPDREVLIEFTVDEPNVASEVRLSTDLVQLTAPRGSSDAKSIQVRSPGQPLQWSIRLLTNSPWLNFSATSGTTPAAVGITGAAGELAPGTYTAVGYFVVEGGNSKLFIVTLTATEANGVMQLDRSAIILEAVEGATRLPTQTLGIYNLGSLDLNWNISIPAGLAWLRAGSTSGAVPAGNQPSNVGISVDPTGLRAGTYHGSISVTAPGAIGAPQSVTVRLQVQPGGTPPRAIFDKSALLFTGEPRSKLRDQSVEISSTGGGLSFSASARASGSGKWLSVNPDNGRVISSSDRFVVRHQVNTDGLAEGTYTGNVTYSFSDGTVQDVSVLLILRTGAVSTKSPLAAGCAPAKQYVIVPGLSNNLSLSVGWPLSMRAQVVDDCGEPSTASTVSATFNNGDPPLILANLKNGQYTGTWTPSRALANVAITIRALRPGMDPAEWKGNSRVVRSSSPPPVLLSGGVVNAASRRTSSLVAPNTIMALRGSDFPEAASEIEVVIGGKSAQVLSTTPEEVRVLAPADFGSQTKTDVIVSARGYLTAPEQVTVVPADPGLFALAEGVTAAVGGTLEVQATGLGAVDGDGNVQLPLTAKVGDLDATVESAVRSPGTPGMYVVRVKIPEGASGTMQLTMTQNGTASNAIAVVVN